MSNFSYKEYNTEMNEEISNDDHILMHLDIDYFFAQVEILKQPELKDQPVIVGHTRARETGRGVVLTCNYPARVYGVHSGQPMKTALENCPKAVIVRSNYEEYRTYSGIIMGILQELEVPMRKAGIDEAYVDITPLVDDYNNALEFGKGIKQEIYDKTQLTVSIGIGPTLKIAKICSDFNKPDGIKVAAPQELDQLFTGLPLIDVPGIGKKTADWLKSRGYTTCDQLQQLNKAELVDIFGKSGLYYYNIFHAKSTNKIKPRGPRKSVSHSRTFHANPGEIEKCLEMVDKLFELSYNTLCKEKFLSKTVGVRVRFNGFDTITRAHSLSFHTQKREQLLKATRDLIMPHLDDPRGIRLLGVGFYNLQKIEEDQKQLEEFFSDEPVQVKDVISLLKEFNPSKFTSSADKQTTTKKKGKRDSAEADLSDFM